MGRWTTTALAVLALLVMAPAAAQAQKAPTSPQPDSWGYLTLPDGAKLKWSVLLPEGKGPFPTLMQYEGYQAGSHPVRATNPKFVKDMLAKGYAIFGVSARGSACSTGTWDLFSMQQAKDGAFALDWGAQQPWSNGRVGLFGYSYGGIMQTWVAAAKPKHLVALAPGNSVGDTYRDISYPGGIPNVVFPPEWGVALQADWLFAAEQALQQGDLECAVNITQHNDPRKTLAVQQLQHPFDDAWHRDHSFVNFVQDIEVPLLGFRTWQDEETGSRQGRYWDKLDPEKTWMVSSNGNHLVYQFSDEWLPTLEGFFDHFVKGEKNGFEKTPRVQVWHETNTQTSNPRSVTTQPRLPERLEQAELPLGPGGTLGAEGAEKDARTSYTSPLPSPAVVDTSSQGLQTTLNLNTWTYVPDLAPGRAVFTTPPLTNTATTYGASSADLWVSTTADDVDLQVTLSEVRPDGQELYINRGWLRASHRAVDPVRSTDLDPYGVHTKASTKRMTPGKPELLRVPVFPSGHTFRPGSSVRIYVELPSVTGLWGYAPILTPQQVTIHHGKSHPSRLVLGLLPNANVKDSRPACDEVLNQPCRANPVPQPSGSLRLVGKPIGVDTTAAEPRLALRFYGRRAARRGVVVKLRATGSSLKGVTVQLRRGKRVVARSKGFTLGKREREVVLRRGGRKAFARGSYSLVVRSGKTLVLRRAVRLG